jgi:hypothetical protein
MSAILYTKQACSFLAKEERSRLAIQWFFQVLEGWIIGMLVVQGTF